MAHDARHAGRRGKMQRARARWESRGARATGGNEDEDWGIWVGGEGGRQSGREGLVAPELSGARRGLQRAGRCVLVAATDPGVKVGRGKRSKKYDEVYCRGSKLDDASREETSLRGFDTFMGMGVCMSDWSCPESEEASARGEYVFDALLWVVDSSSFAGTVGRCVGTGARFCDWIVLWKGRGTCVVGGT